MRLKSLKHATSHSLIICPQGLLGIAKQKVESIVWPYAPHLGMEVISWVAKFWLVSVAKEVQS